MNQDQKKYLIKRIDEIVNQKMSAREHQEKSVKFSEVANEIGKFKKPTVIVAQVIEKFRQENNHSKAYCSISLAVEDFLENIPEIEHVIDINKKANSIEDKLIKKRNDKIAKDSIELKDKIMFGKEDEAYKMLADFTMKKYPLE